MVRGRERVKYINFNIAGKLIATINCLQKGILYIYLVLMQHQLSILLGVHLIEVMDTVVMCNCVLHMLVTKITCSIFTFLQIHIDECINY